MVPEPIMKYKAKYKASQYLIKNFQNISEVNRKNLQKTAKNPIWYQKKVRLVTAEILVLGQYKMS